MNEKPVNDKSSDLEIDFLFDEMSIKPITSGLGFHHEKQQSQMPTSSSRTIEKKPILHFSESIEKKDFLSMGELEPFYKDAKEEAIDNEIELIQEMPIEAFDMAPNPLIIASAWLVDIVALVSIFSSAIMLSNYLIGFNQLSFDSLMDASLWSTFGIIWGLLYLFYFTFMDRAFGQTLGKLVFDLELRSAEKESSLSLFKTFFRSILSLCTVATFGLTNLLKINDRLTKTKIEVKRKK